MQVKHLITVKDLRVEEIKYLQSLFNEFKRGRKEKLDGRSALLFLESSTRTRLSFEIALRNLGMETYYIGRGESSMEKGESFGDTIKNFSALGFRLVVFRVPFVLYPYESYLVENISLINAGDGTHQHPTQGLIDLFTAMEHYPSLENLKILFVGDILHSRVFRSSGELFRMFGAQLGVCGPATLIPSDLSPFGEVRVFDSVDEGIEWADLVVYLRLQEERFKENYISSKEAYFLQFGLTKERYRKLKGYFMHPGPVNVYVDIDGELVYGDKSLVLKQVQNGLYVRKAVVYYLLVG
ncbi:aspartate carbamoyltransferase catalytic subunit [Thermocrinis sp.]|uniref:aspartate carbamoyltransferase catalytic subunit n=1 Tax=Thermocrinis sp. TaxID=2024383 RepID=UPI002FDCA2B7